MTTASPIDEQDRPYESLTRPQMRALLDHLSEREREAVALRFGAELSAEQGYHAARLATLSILATLKQALGDLDRIAAWLMVSGMINVAPGFIRTTNIINGCSDLFVAVLGERGRHARSAVGMGGLPANIPVEIEAIMRIAD